MWAMEYNPNIFSADESNSNNNGACILNDKQLKRYGKFVRKNVKSGQSDQHSALAVFLVASVLETKNKKLLKEAKGLDDVVKVFLSLSSLCARVCINIHLIVECIFFRFWVTLLEIWMLKRHVTRH